MVDGSGVVIYVGKAKDLKRRLSSYLRHRGHSASKTGVMVSKVERVRTMVTATEKEAFILEAALIKEHRPRYNILLRDDKNYPLIKVTVQERWPRLLMTRRRQGDGARYFGPYSSSSSMWETIKYLNKLFPLRRCKGAKLKGRERPCLNYQMKRCPAPCLGEGGREAYMRAVDAVLAVLSGKSKALIKGLEGEMAEAAAALEFERAAEIRDKISALKKTTEKQVIVSAHVKDQDVLALHSQDGVSVLAVIHVRGGVVNGFRDLYLGELTVSASESMAEIIRRFYGDEQEIPKEIIVSVLPEEGEGLADWLSDKRGNRVTLRQPKRGDGRRLVEMALDNGRRLLEDRLSRQRSWEGTREEMCRLLRLPKAPERIICMDISNIGGKQSVGAVVSFLGGEKESAAYRHYKIRTVDGPNDYASMSEVLERHLKRAEEGGFLPDLLLVDGGKGQLAMAVAAVEALNLRERVMLAGIAKERGDEGEKLYRPGRKNPIVLPPHSPILLLLMRIRDESHRFGITFHRKWRRRETLTSELQGIVGLGPVRQQALLEHLGSVSRIRTATCEELAQVPGISMTLARTIKESLGSLSENS